MLYNIVWVSAVQQRESVISIHISSPSCTSLPYPSPCTSPFSCRLPFTKDLSALTLISKYVCFFGASLVAQIVKSLPAMRETWVRSLGQENLLEKGMAIPSVFFPGEPHRQRSLVGCSPWGCSRTRPRDWITSFTSLTFACILQFCHELGLGSLTHCDFT